MGRRFARRLPLLTGVVGLSLAAGCKVDTGAGPTYFPPPPLDLGTNVATAQEPPPPRPNEPVEPPGPPKTMRERLEVPSELPGAGVRLPQLPTDPARRPE